FEKTIARNLGHEIERAQQRHAVFHQSAERTRKLRVIAVSNHPSVPWNQQPEPVPSEPPFLSPNDGTETDYYTNQYQSTEPPVAGDRMVNLKQDARRQRHRAAGLRHESGQLRHHERNKNCDENSAGQREECWIN